MKRSTKLLTRVQGPSQPGPAGPGRSALSHWLDPDVGRALFADYARAWVTERPNLRPRTLRLYEALSGIHLVPGVGPLAGCGRHRPANPALAKEHFHDLRHTVNTLAGGAGASLHELMDRMSHSNTRCADLPAPHVVARQDDR